MSRYDGQLQSHSFAEDEQVRVGTDRSEAWVSERLLDRLLTVGRAYGLHVLSILSDVPRHEQAWVNRQQAEALLDEVGFLTAVLEKDAAFQALSETVVPLVAEAARYGGDDALVFEGP